MRRVYTRGIKQANKHVVMASLCYNIKKYLKFIRLNPIANKNYSKNEAFSEYKNYDF